jgi:hypothetical protein
MCEKIQKTKRETKRETKRKEERKKESKIGRAEEAQRQGAKGKVRLGEHVHAHKEKDEETKRRRDEEASRVRPAGANFDRK